MGSIFSGLVQCGAWGCFDEFNRIEAEVLSVVSSQIRQIQEALKNGLTRFPFEGELQDVNFEASWQYLVRMARYCRDTIHEKQDMRDCPVFPEALLLDQCCSTSHPQLPCSRLHLLCMKVSKDMHCQLREATSAGTTCTAMTTIMNCNSAYYNYVGVQARR